MCILARFEYEVSRNTKIVEVNPTLPARRPDRPLARVDWRPEADDRRPQGFHRQGRPPAFGQARPCSDDRHSRGLFGRRPVRKAIERLSRVDGAQPLGRVVTQSGRVLAPAAGIATPSSANAIRPHKFFGDRWVGVWSVVFAVCVDLAGFPIVPRSLRRGIRWVLGRRAGAERALLPDQHPVFSLSFGLNAAHCSRPTLACASSRRSSGSIPGAQANDRRIFTSMTTGWASASVSTIHGRTTGDRPIQSRKQSFPGRPNGCSGSKHGCLPAFGPAATPP